MANTTKGGTNAQLVSDSEFQLDTSSFAAVISYAERLTTSLGDIKQDLDQQKNDLVLTWVGNGRNMFDKKYRLLTQQLGDIHADLRDLAESLKDAEQSYIQADIDLAKTLDGITRRY